MYKKLLACGLALLMCGCSAKAAGNDQVLTVGLSSEMNGTFSPMYYQTTNDSYVVDLVYQGLLKYNKKGELVADLATLDFGYFGIELICPILGQPANNADTVAMSLQAVQIAGEGGEVNKRASVRIYACVRGFQLCQPVRVAVEVGNSAVHVQIDSHCINSLS